jgi:hypothetical protein
MFEASKTPEQLIELLEAGPGRIHALLAVRTPEQLRAKAADGGWSAVDVLAHLRSCADVWGGYIARLIAEDNPTFKAVNPTTYMQQTDYPDLAFWPSFGAFAAQRKALLGVLTKLQPGDWKRSATVTGSGKPRVRTVYTYVEWLAVHERSHFRQIKNIAKG